MVFAKAFPFITILHPENTRLLLIHAEDEASMFPPFTVHISNKREHKMYFGSGHLIEWPISKIVRSTLVLHIS